MFRDYYMHIARYNTVCVTLNLSAPSIGATEKKDEAFSRTPSSMLCISFIVAQFHSFSLSMLVRSQSRSVGRSVRFAQLCVCAAIRSFERVHIRSFRIFKEILDIIRDYT